MKRIVWGDKPFDKNGEEPTHKITGLCITNYDIIVISYELTNGNTNTVSLTMELAEKIGLINFNLLDSFIK